MKRIGIFQLYHESGKVEEYVEKLLAEMARVVSKVVIVCNGALEEKEYSKLKQYSNAVYGRANIGYDAGGYKDIFLTLHKEDWNQWDEAVMFNCSFYGPICSLENVFNTMDREDVDFWGLSRHLGDRPMRKGGPEIPEHLQSYFLVVRRSMLQSVHFWEFWRKLDYPQSYYEAVENFECKFTLFFKDKNFRYTSWLDVMGADKVIGKGINPWADCAYDIISAFDFPIVKCKAMSIANFGQMKKIMLFLEKNTTYPIDLIINHIKHLDSENRWKPYSVNILEKFVMSHNRIYIFGNGKYGKGLGEWFRHRKWEYESHVVSTPCHEDEIAFDDFSMCEKDGLIVALGREALDEMEHMIRCKFKEDQLLFPLLS